MGDQFNLSTSLYISFLKINKAGPCVGHTVNSKK